MAEIQGQIPARICKHNLHGTLTCPLGVTLVSPFVGQWACRFPKSERFEVGTITISVIGNVTILPAYDAMGWIGAAPPPVQKRFRSVTEYSSASRGGISNDHIACKYTSYTMKRR